MLPSAGAYDNQKCPKWQNHLRTILSFASLLILIVAKPLNILKTSLATLCKQTTPSATEVQGMVWLFYCYFSHFSMLQYNAWILFSTKVFWHHEERFWKKKTFLLSFEVFCALFRTTVIIVVLGEGKCGILMQNITHRHWATVRATVGEEYFAAGRPCSKLSPNSNSSPIHTTILN